MILMASECLFLAYNEILTTACIQGIQKGEGMQLEAKRGAPWPLKDFFHSLLTHGGPQSVGRSGGFRVAWLFGRRLAGRRSACPSKKTRFRP